MALASRREARDAGAEQARTRGAMTQVVVSHGHTLSSLALLLPHRGLMMARVPQIPVTMLEMRPRIRVMEKPCSGPEPMA